MLPEPEVHWGTPHPAGARASYSMAVGLQNGVSQQWMFPQMQAEVTRLLCPSLICCTVTSVIFYWLGVSQSEPFLTLWGHYYPIRQRYRKKITDRIPYELHVKILHKIPANWILQHIKRILYLEQVESIPGIHGWFNIWTLIQVIHPIHRIQDKTTWSPQRMQQKYLARRHTRSWKKTLNKLGIKGNLLNLLRGIYEKPTTQYHT